jgi:glycerophosphoryl diester phosphodiesterase
MNIVGHAGARGLAPANTLASFHKALEYAVDAIEFDVHVTSDHIPVLHHDPHLFDTFGARLLIAEHTLDDLRQYKPDLTTLDAAIQTINHAVPLHIEVKPGVAMNPITTTIQHYLDMGWAIEDFMFASFDQQTLQACYDAFPDCQTIVIESWSSWRARKRARSLNTTHIAMNQRWLWRPFINAMKANGYNLYAYTVNNPHQGHHFEKAGLAGIITDYPDRFCSKRAL